MSIGDRSRAMLERVARSARNAGVDEAGALLVEGALAASLQLRAQRTSAEHHSLLHPARAVLILLEDARLADAEPLAAAAITDTIEPELAPAAVDAVLVVGARVVELREQVPIPAAEPELLLEALLAAPRPVALIALADRLDHMRHLHLLPRSEWGPLHEETVRCYLPVATRSDAVLARRYEWWCGMFGRRFLEG